MSEDTGNATANSDGTSKPKQKILGMIDGNARYTSMKMLPESVKYCTVDKNGTFENFDIKNAIK
jgi:hypothetical protein